jgi:hypothetical protein
MEIWIRVNDMTEPMFKILNDPIITAIPWAAIAPHEEQAKRNHSQTLSGLNRRGGLSIHEAYYVMTDQTWPRAFPAQTPVRDATFRKALMRLCLDFEKAKEVSP